MMNFISRLINLSVQRMLPSARFAQDQLLYWRAKILATMVLSGLAVFIFGLMIAAYLAFAHGLWNLLIIDSFGYMLCFGVLFIRGPSYELRASVIVLSAYGIGVLVIGILGPLSGGPIWLFTSAVIAGVLLGSRAALLVVAANGTTIFLLGFLIHQAYFGQGFPFFKTTAATLAAGINFIALNLMVAISVSVLLKRLSSSHHQENLLAGRLEDERQELIKAKAQLEKEVEERKQIEIALRAREAQYRLLADNASDVIWTLDISRKKVTYVSPSIEKMRGFTPQEAMELPLEKTFTPDSRRKVEKLLSRVLIMDHRSGEDRSMTLEVEMYKKDGSTLWAEFSLSLIPDAQGRADVVIGITRDISERKRAEQERIKLEGQLRQARKMEAIGTLAGGIAHDFNNILSAIIGFTELCLDDVSKEAQLHDNLQEILSAGQRAKELVKQILTFARQSTEDVNPIQVSTIVKEALKLIRSTTPATIQISTDIASDAQIMGNPAQVHQVLMNLCTNSVHAMEKEGGTLTVRLTDRVLAADQASTAPELKPGHYLQLTVADTGTGIAREILPFIFDPYFTTKEVGKGTGMGLAMVHGIVETYGGKIEVESQPGQGATFTIYFPVTQNHEVQPVLDSQSLPRGDERILLVDDELSIIRIGAQILERLGYTVTAQSSSMEALALFRKQPMAFDLVITDLAMPNLTGDRLAAKLIAIRPELPILLCTGFSDQLSAENAAALGIRGFAYKPIVRAELAKLVRKALDETKGGFNLAAASIL
ncbi:MAG: ATP-binding protein [Desulfobacteraceae bacterium]|nr:ATP-binding protein [Desulfobacteraceae bacterium]